MRIAIPIERNCFAQRENRQSVHLPPALPASAVPPSNAHDPESPSSRRDASAGIGVSLRGGT